MSQTITIIAHVNSKKPRIEADLFGDLHVYVAQPPLDGKANIAIAKALAEHFDTSYSNVNLIRGATSKHKIFKIE